MNLVKTVSEILKKEVSEQEAKDFALDQFGTLCAFLKNKEEFNQFPNGLLAWQETHHEVVSAMTIYLEKDSFDKELNNEFCNKYREEGTGGIYELAIDWTNQFEKRFEGVNWGLDLEFFETIEEFLTEKFLK